MYVPFSFVNDGICDYDICCDGTEEYGGIGGVKCENKCDEIGKEYRRLEEEKRKNMEKAAKRRDALLKEAQALRQKIEAKVSGLKTEIGILEARRDKLARKHREAEQQAKGKVVGGEGGGGKLGVLVGLAKTRVNELRDTLNNVVDQRDALKDRVGELEELLTKFQSEYNPNFNDEGVKSALRSFEGYSARVASEKGQRQDVNDADVLSVLREDSETNGVNWNEFEQGDGCDTDISKSQQLPTLYRIFITNMSSLQSRSLPPILRPVFPPQLLRLPPRLARHKRNRRRQRRPWPRIHPRPRRSRGPRSRRTRRRKEGQVPQGGGD